MRTALQALLLAGLAAWVYGPCLHGGWLWDDGLEVTRNLALRSPGGWWEPWVRPAGMDYFPLKGSLQWIEWHLWGARPLGYHLSNLTLHVASALLLWRLLGRLGVAAAYPGALLFAVHPLAVESVAWISEFKNTVSLPFLLGACLAFVAFDRTGRRGAYVAALLAFVAALACKTSVVMFPVVLLLFAWWQRGRITGRDLARAAPFFAASLALGLATVHFQAERAIGAGAAPVPLAARVGPAGWSILSYARQAVWPTGLAPIYPAYAPGRPAWIPWGVVAGGVGLLWGARRGWGRPALLGSGWFLLNLVPVLGLLPMSYLRVAPRADHFAYVSLVGFAGLAAAGLDGVVRRVRLSRFVSGLAAAAVVGVLALAARDYAAVFRDEASLWTAAVRRNPDSWLAHNNLGEVDQRAGQPREAQVEYARAVALRPDSPEAHANLGTTLEALGDATGARRQYREALRLDPGFAGAHYDLGLSFLNLGSPDRAEEEFRAAVRLDPSRATAHNNLGLALARQQRFGEAIAEYAAALRLDPALPEAHLNLGNGYFRTDRLEEAVAEYQVVLRLDPANAGGHANLAQALRRLGRAAEAEQALRAVPPGGKN